MKPLRRIAALVAALVSPLALGACADAYLAVDGAGHHTAEPPRANLTQASIVPTTVATRPDTCGAAPLQYLIGKPKSEVPIPLDPSKRRVYCSTCMITMDYQADRLDIVFDQTSGLVTAVKCG